MLVPPPLSSLSLSSASLCPPRTTSALPSFFFNDPATTEIYTLSLHDALPISRSTWIGTRRATPSRTRNTVIPSALRTTDNSGTVIADSRSGVMPTSTGSRFRYYQSFRSEEHTSELQSRPHLVCRLLLEKKNKS